MTEAERPPWYRRASFAVTSRARWLNEHPRLLFVLKFMREVLPGDSRYGDPLSVAGDEQRHIVGRRLAELTRERPGLLREAGLSALQVWQALAEAQGRGRGDEEMAILFTDLVSFSDWAVRAGDDAALELLRDVGEAIEPPVSDHDGHVVKRLGDGMMAVFDHAQDAVDAVVDARARLRAIEVDGYDPQIRAGLHVGRPRRIGGDFIGVDVNVAARVAEQAGGDEILVSDRALEDLDTDRLSVKRKRFVKAKGLPKGMTIHVVTPR